MTRAHFVKKARKDIAGTDIKKGDSYYWWKFRFGAKQVSKTPPKRSQLTQSSFFSQLYDIEDRIGNLTVKDDLESEIGSIVSDLESLRDECQEKHDNMPEQLQDSGSGEILQSRVDGLDEMIGEFEGIDTNVDEAGFEEEAKEEAAEEREGEEPKSPEEIQKRVDELKEEKIQARNQEILEEIQGISYSGE